MARAGITVERLVEAGAKLADEEGFEAITATALARQFNVQVASLYSHVKNTHELKSRIALFALNALADRVADAVAGNAGKDGLVALANAHRDFAIAHPGLFTASRYTLDDDVIADSGGVRIARLTRAVLRSYALSEPDETHAVRLIGSVLLGFTTLELGGNFGHSAPPPAASWTRSLDAIDAALQSWSRAAP